MKSPRSTIISLSLPDRLSRHDLLALMSFHEHARQELLDFQRRVLIALDPTLGVEDRIEALCAVCQMEETSFRGSTDADDLALDLIDEACSDMASRFFERIREQHGLAYSVGTTQVIGMAPGLFTFYLSTAPEQLEFAQKELLSEIHNLAQDGLTAEELDRARRTWTGKQAMQHQSNAGLAQQCALNELYGLGYDHDQRILDRVRTLPLEEVNAVARRYFAGIQPILSRVTPGTDAIL